MGDGGLGLGLGLRLGLLFDRDRDRDRDWARDRDRDSVRLRLKAGTVLKRSAPITTPCLGSQCTVNQSQAKHADATGQDGPFHLIAMEI